MGKIEYYFVQKSRIEDFFPCRIIKQHNNSCLEIENLETGAKENLIDGRHYKTEIYVKPIAQQINSFIEKEGVILRALMAPLGEDNSRLSFGTFLFLAKKDEIENIEKAAKEIKEESEFYNYLKTLNCVITIEDLFEVLEKKYNIILSSEEKKNIILKLDKPKK
ncbi:hypothetical protein [Capnocytophaga sputigena]|jgi:hypothetical protein|uniref:hypothetical protein n=1 Tax=Capnocytophaga sputigena TaxID=1019 RepID=UPI0028D5A95A|nr:hypothetical protein [Capnocytophaga sputigena]